jgi:hypothetical protein
MQRQYHMSDRAIYYIMIGLVLLALLTIGWGR